MAAGETVALATAGAGAPGASTLGARVRSGALWGVVNNLALRFANIAVTVIVVRLVTPEEFGVFAVALTVSVVVSGFADWGAAAFVVRGDIDPEEVGPTVTAVTVLSGLVLAGGVWLGAAPLAGVFGTPAATNEIRVMTLVLVVGGVIAVPNALLVREFRQRELFLATLAGFVPSSLLLVALAAQGAGAMSFAWSRVLAIVVQGAVVVWLAGRFHRPHLDPAVLRLVAVFGLPLAGANLVNYVLVNADYALVGHRFGAHQLGEYMLAFSVSSWAAAVLSSAINSVAMPAFSRVWTDRDLLAAALARSARSVALVAFGIAAVLCALAGPLVAFLYGPRWSASAPVLGVLAAYGGCFAVVSLLSNLLVGAGRTGRTFWIQVLWLALLFPAMAVGAERAGIVGVAWAHVVVVVVVVLPAYVVATLPLVRGLPRVLAGALAGPLACALAGGAAAWGTAQLLDAPVWQVLLGGVAGAVVLALTGWRWWRDLLRAGTGRAA